MTYNKLIDKIFVEGKEIYEDMECYINTSNDLELTVLDGELSNYTISKTEGLSFRGLKDGNMGYSYTEKVDESSIDVLIKEARDNAMVVDTADKEIIYEGSGDYVDFEREKSNLSSVSVDKKIELLKSMEKAALDFSDKIKSVNYCLYNESTGKTYIRNTKGLDLQEENSIGQLYLSVVAKEGEDIKTGSATELKRDFNEFDYKELVSRACRDAISMLGSESIESDKYKIIVYNKTFTSLLGAFLSVFVADNVQKGMSLMKDKIGESIGSSVFTLREDPHMKNGYNSRSFDDEGTATKAKDIISAGVLKTYLYNWKTALKDGIESTGNGFRNSYKGGSNTAFTNLVVEPGEKSYKDLLIELENGLVITELQGLHSGLNAVSGDFSLSASGYEIKEGKVYRPINQITIAGNLVDLLNNIEQIGSDEHMSSLGISSPSVLIKDISVSGK